ncbi:MAG: hypothetical protein JO253_00555 [Alphaproteobacteria bacterium]|nr:hypothetical protein [Alphaproteobacteria bacterium]
MPTPAIGGLMIGVQASPPQPGAGATVPNAPNPYSTATAQQVIQDITRRLRGCEVLAAKAAPADKIVSMIAISQEAILIQSSKIAMVGEVTFADWQRDVNGVATGVIDPSITQIRGGVIKTQKVQSFDGNSFLDLDATVASGNPFISCDGAVLIYPNGNFTFGPTSGKQLKWDGTNLSIQDNVNQGTTTVLTTAQVVAGANNGTSALSGLANKLNKSASDILTGAIAVNTTGGIAVGTITWNSSGVLTGGSGVAITSNGIVGAKSGSPSFTIDTAGNATFYGTLSAATGTFAGDISAATGTFTGNLSTGGYASAAGGTTIAGYKATFYANTGTADYNGFFANMNNSRSGLFIQQAGSGAAAYISGASSFQVAQIVATTSNASYPTLQVSANNSASNYGLQVIGTTTLQGALTLTNQTIGTGSSTATFTSTNKPASNSSNTWLTLNVNGTNYYLPMWT